ncbi:RagB/SusD family nutrient uptake outer membrane protein [Dysgonomonas sp. 216]|uniref:RagB/SusD family nutrient uptake outer membrane protein n=1 Tax=Dysgonomonas sp. 216 TaxID=2302934 RepID=UPI002102AA6E|nr:RagB/SusD family nutrient uptake outer membrane protein [Dysgonomonas sp. 216]
MKLKYIFSCLCILSALVVFSGCEDMLDTDSDRYAFEEDHDLKSPNDSLYSLMGILSQLQKIGDRYVIMGELRGDLMTVSEDASIALKEINAFNVSEDNSYREKYDYYNIINNCNYAISKMDTSIVFHTEKVMLPEFAAIKAIRAWTYWQMAQIYGKVYYMEEPILSLESSLAKYPEKDIDELAGILIEDLLPYVNVDRPDYGMIDGKYSYFFSVPVRMLLGDLYLFKNLYPQAAAMYHDQIYEGYLITRNYASFWTTTVQDAFNAQHGSSYRNEVMSIIPYSTSIKDFHSNLVRMSFNNTASLLPVKGFMDEMALKPHFHAAELNGNITGYFEGDLRGSIKSGRIRYEIGDSYGTIQSKEGAKDLIYKYFNAATAITSATDPENELLPYPYILTEIPIYRNPQLYLRYAEAVNRAGKPTLAFAVLKYGLNTTTINDPQKVNYSEIANNEPYIDFAISAEAITNNVGTASRGRGLGISRDASIFVIPDFTQENVDKARQDSIDWVETQILDEMAAETAYEGSRFFDLLRISRHRDGHPAFMAEKVSRKYEDSEGMKSLLMDINSWFIK